MEKENRNLLDQLVNAENVKEELELEIQRLSSLKKKVSFLSVTCFEIRPSLEKYGECQRRTKDSRSICLELFEKVHSQFNP